MADSSSIPGQDNASGFLSGLGGLVGGIIGRSASADDQAKGYQAWQDAIDEIKKTGAPPNLAVPILLNHFKKAGIYTPQLEQTITEGASKLGDIQEDPSLRNAQTGALAALQARGKVGLTAEDRVGMNKVLNQARQDQVAKQNQIINQFAARGQGGSGAQLAAQLQQSQSGANREADQADQIAAAASGRALNAIGQAGQLSGQIRNQDFTNKSTIANAQDQMQRFNINNQLGQIARNTQAQNQGQLYNVQQGDKVNNANTMLDNAELERQKQAQATDWGNNLKYHGIISGADMGASGLAFNKAQDTAKFWQGIGNATGQLAGTMSGGKSGAPAAGGNGNGGSDYSGNSTASGTNQGVDPTGGGFGSGLSSVDTNLAAYSKGGMVRGYADGGSVDTSFDNDILKRLAGKHGGAEDSLTYGVQVPSSGGGDTGGGGDSLMKLAPLALMALAHGGAVPESFKWGGSVPGVPTVPGDSSRNDTVPAMLSPGEVVVPNSRVHNNPGGFVKQASTVPSAPNFLKAPNMSPGVQSAAPKAPKGPNLDPEGSLLGKILHAHNQRLSSLEFKNNLKK